MTRIHRPLRGAFCFAAGAAAAACFMVSPEGYAGMSAAPAASTSYLWTALAVCFGLLLRHVYVCKGLRPRALHGVFGVLFGVLNAFGMVLFATDSWRMGTAELLLHLVRGVGQSLPMTAFFVWLEHALASGMPAGEGPHLPACVQRHPIPCLMGVMIVCWSPYLIAFFPGTVCWDLGEMAAQYFGVYEMDTWHPVFTTWLFGGCMQLGRMAGSDNLGAALFTLLQTLALSYALSRAVLFVRRCGLGRAAQAGALAFFALTPIWGGYAQFISKDTLYTSALLLYVLAVLDMVLLREADGSVRLRHGAELLVWGLLSCLLRSNGLYVVAPTALMAVLLAAKGRGRVTAAAGGAAAVACALLFSNVLIPALGIRNESTIGLYSTFFQQSARVLRDHADTVTPEEYAQIDRVLDAEHLAELYEPWIHDPVKYTFRQYGTGEQAEKAALGLYMDTWLSMLKKYPLTYAESFFAGNLSYYVFAPKLEGDTYNDQAGNRLVFETYELGDSRGEDPRFVDTTQIARLEPVRRLLAAFARGWRHIPGRSMLYVCAAYTWLLVGAGIAAAHRRRWRLLLAGFLPALLSLGVCMLSPVNDYFRYFLPVVAMTVPLVAAAAKKPS